MASPTEAVRQYALDRVIAPARRRGETQVRINAGDVARALKLPNTLMPTVCNALSAKKKFLQANRLCLDHVEGPPSRQSPTVTFTYGLQPEPAAETAEQMFQSLRGLFHGVWDEDGGGEAWLKAERGDDRVDPGGGEIELERPGPACLPCIAPNGAKQGGPDPSLASNFPVPPLDRSRNVPGGGDQGEQSGRSKAVRGAAEPPAKRRAAARPAGSRDAGGEP